MAVSVVDCAADVAQIEGLVTKPREGDCIDLTAGKAAADIFLNFRPAPGQLAFWVEGVTNPALRGPINYLPYVPSEAYALPGIPEGTYRLHAATWEAPAGASASKPSTPADLAQGGPFTVLERSQLCFQVRRFEDFVASYEWQPVERWHRVPVGLEICLDLGGSGGDGGRKARIPQPWTWDARIAGEAAPRRVHVEAETTVGELLKRAGLQEDTHEVIFAAGGFERILESAWTAKQADLFRHAKQVEIRRK
mmetsp:Transcript_168216/g.540434  ORF Transcript_168216/g.540434 Transcript_168216/m.540434 type:complete len:251 (-) Transcript_168216:143-895(-)